MPALDTRRSPLPSSRHRRTGAALLATVVAVSAVGAGTLAPPPALAASAADLDLSGGDSTLLTSSSETLAPGLELTDFRRLQPAGWVTGHVMRADLTTPTLSLDVLDAGSVTGGATLSDQIAGTGAVAAVNGDYFDMNNSTAPVGTNISPSQGVRTLAPDTRPAFTIADGLAAVQALTSAATVTIDGTTHDVTGVNSPTIGTGGIGWYTPAWGTHTLARPLGAPATVVTPMTKVTVADGVVTEVSTDPASVDGDAAIAEGTGVLIGREAGAATLAMLEVGDTVDVTVSASADVDLAVSGSQRLIIDGEQTDADQVEASRTAIGVNRDGTEITVVTIDGRAGDSRGMTLRELGDLMLDLNVHNAVNLDGGGSTMLAVREPGETDASIHNRPSDGSERVVANSLAFFSTAETGVVSDVRVAPALDVTDADAVFPGLQRTVSGTGVDDNLTGVAVAGSFSASTDAAVRVASSTEASAQLEGLTPGTATVSFTAEGKTASTQLRVLGELERIRPSATVVALSEPGQTATVRLTGLDADGFSAPIETGDVTVEHGADVTVEATGLDEFTVAPVVDSGSATVTFTAGGRSVDVAVTVGYRTIGIADFADAAEWTAGVARATGTLTPATGPEGQPALTMSYDFTTSTGTRGYYAIVPGEAATGGRVLEGQPQALTLWMHGDGSGAWPRLQLKTGVGTTINLDGPMVDWTGWRQARFTVPAGTAYPLTFQRVRMMETRPAASYQGEITIASLESVVAPDVDQPVATRVFDPVIVADGSVDDRAQRIAVMNDAQFVARNPDSDLVQATRETLREIVAAEPDYLVINGDLVDEASVADFELAARILEEEVGDRIPYVYVPGNHEIMGGAISNFIDAFGDPYRSVDLGGTRMITLNSAAGSFRASGLDQLRFLEERLDDAAADPTVTGVLVFSHHPVDDPLPTKASQLSDRTEAAQFVETLTSFRAETGKSAAMVNGHVGVFDATSYDGVSRILGGNAGKGPSGTPDAGGFTGWTMLGVNPGSGVVGSSPEVVVDRIRWMQAETKPRVEPLAVQAPSVMEVGETAAVSASLMQDGARVVPVTWPVSAEWGGEGVDVVGASGVDATARGLTSGLEAAAAGALRVNPATGEVTAVAPGEASLSVTVNGVTETVAVSVVGEEPGEPEEPGEGSGEEPGEGENPTPAPTPTPTPTPTDSASPAPAPGTGGTDVGDTGAGDAAGGLSSEDPLAVTGADVDPALWAAALGLLLVAGGIGARLWYLRRPDRGTV
ncbi:phosphodiester glycosidase family protein [Microbacterium aurantiacum]|uniref:phosphodiester glycosidase family protein n=1 Tax=Microbacterium aurantiacum TaxID=162393 RepID=UPI00341BFC21